MPTVASLVGKKIKGRGGREGREEHEERGMMRGGREQRGSKNRGDEGRDHRRKYAEAFDIESETDWLWGTIFLVALLFVLSPGVLLTLPPGRGRIFMSGNTSTIAALVHAVLITLIFNYM